VQSSSLRSELITRTEKEKVYIPKNEKLRMEIIQLYHDVPAAEHEERWKTMELVVRNC